MGQRLAPGCGVVAFRPRLKPPRSATPLRALYDEAGDASWLARALAGHRITCTGLVGPAPGGAEDWLALGEDMLAPCQACGGDHHWPLGVLVVQAPRPRLEGPLVTATVQGVLDTAPGAGTPAGARRRLALRDAAVELG